MKENKILMLILLNLLFFNSKAQLIKNNKSHNNFFVNDNYVKAVNRGDPIPKVSNLFKSARVQPDLITGELEANIPLYTIKTGHISIPITLSYNSDLNDGEGVCDQFGEDWRLSTACSITRKVNGYPDDFNNVFSLSLFRFVNGYYYTGKEVIKVDRCLANKDFSFTSNLDSYENIDLEIDEYFYSLPGKSNGKFYLDEKGVAVIEDGDNVEIEVFPKSNPKLLTSFCITTSDGMRYYFGNSESSVQYSTKENISKEYSRYNQLMDQKTFGIGYKAYGLPNYEEAGYVGYYPGFHADSFEGSNENKSTGIPKHKTKWFVTKIEDLEGNVAEFNYKSVKQNVSYYHSSNISVQTTGILDFFIKGESTNENILHTVYSTPTISFNVTQTKVEEEIPSLESVVTRTHKAEIISKRDRVDLTGADRIERIVISANNGSRFVNIKNYEFEYDIKRSSSDCDFSYDLFYRDIAYGASPVIDIGNPFYHPETINQEVNRMFLSKITEVAPNGNKLPSFEFEYDNDSVEKQNPYPIITYEKAPDFLYDISDEIKSGLTVRIDGYGEYDWDIDNIFSPNGVPDYKVKDYRMPFVRMKNYKPINSQNGNMTRVRYPGGSEKIIKWKDSAVDRILTRDRIEDKTVLKEQYSYQWVNSEFEPYELYHIGKNSVVYVKHSYHIYNGAYKVYPNDTRSKDYDGYLRVWSVKDLRNEFGNSKRASKKTIVKALDASELEPKGKGTVGEICYFYNIESNNLKEGSEYYFGDKPPRYGKQMPLSYAGTVNPRHGWLDSVVYYSNAGLPLKKLSYKYDIVFDDKKRTLSSFKLGSTILKWHELENFGNKKEYEYFQVARTGGECQFKRKLSEVEESIFYDGNTRNIVSKKTDYSYRDIIYKKPYVNTPNKITSTFSDGTKQIMEFRHVSDFNDLTTYFNTSACDECYEEYRDCMKDCGAREKRQQQFGNELRDPGRDANPACYDYCSEDFQMCKENCDLAGLNSFSRAIRELNKKKAYGIPLETVSWKEENGVKTLLSAQLSMYNHYGGGICRPNQFLAFPNPGNVSSFNKLQLVNNNLRYDLGYETVGYIDRYDSYGNVEEYHAKDGKYVCTIWGYDGQYPVLQVQNASYGNLGSAFGYSNLAALKSSNRASGFVSQYKNMLKHSAMKNSLATFNCYNLKGALNEQYDSNGRRKSFKYDEFGRLITEKDNDGNILNQYEYHYSNHANQNPVSPDPLEISHRIYMTDAEGNPSSEPLGLIGYREFNLHITGGTGNYSVLCRVICRAGNGETFDKSRVYKLDGNDLKFFPLVPFPENMHKEFTVNFTIRDGKDNKQLSFRYVVLTNLGGLRRP